ncbi:hypothetical protein FE257_006676 [Aspergillus nanangensis]|uniref:C2H2-type domain-containing protein n=1 Tax=Aspergillus nanangensis TaxID=2582783 RepID=A0AAD4CNZ5_ASPNN|nr:hypothetical protein FE257_006676 [Aspergillus nanangensis]
MASTPISADLDGTQIDDLENELMVLLPRDDMSIEKSIEKFERMGGKNGAQEHISGTTELEERSNTNSDSIEGQTIFRCNFEGCDKVYSHRKHLSRHELNRDLYMRYLP